MLKIIDFSMQLIKSSFNNFDQYQEAARGWELDLRLLSKNDFSADLSMFSSKTFLLTRTKLFGKIDQFGLTPKGFRSLVVPVNYNNEYVWLHKRVSGKDLLIFPKDGTLDAVSYSDFDNYIISINEDILFQVIDQLDYKNCKKLFNGDEQVLHITKEFSLSFHLLADNFLNSEITDNKWVALMENNMIHFLLKYIEESNENTIQIPKRRKDIALRKAVDIINNTECELISIPELCGLVGVSERTLLYAFKNKFQISPSDYIKSVRLNKVRRDLFQLKDQNTSISSIAGKYHFWHMGQFAQDFNKQFGVLPSDI